MIENENILRQVLASYARFGDVALIKKVDAGLINKTFLVDAKAASFILQEVSPIFEACVNDDSEAVSRHLSTKGILSPRILKTDAGELYCAKDARVFRALEFIAGHTFHKVNSDKMATES